MQEKKGQIIEEASEVESESCVDYQFERDVNVDEDDDEFDYF